uniref:S phase cyclin A-associated protein in the endoplasmic reticulum N-terminal domain-containing protein n=1 Tax=Strigamia maritima TaxID=126957 RepID=T1JJ52_STRMM
MQINEMDEVRKLVQEEGRSARNLLTYNVPLENSQNEHQHDDSKRKRNVLSKRADKCPTLRKMRIRSASAGRNPKSELHARHWAFLFENLQRAVDEIYNTCETDESIMECKEVILILDNFTKEFNALIDWINVKRDYEKSSVMRQRPPFLAWEIRKSSPVKQKEKQSLNLTSTRVFNFDQERESRQMATVATQVNQTEISSLGKNDQSCDLKIEEKIVAVIPDSKMSEEIEENKINCEKNVEKKEIEVVKSWADKVKGEEMSKLEEKENQEDSEGWEIVQRSKFRVRNSPPQKLIHNLVNDTKEKRKKDRAGSVPLENKKISRLEICINAARKKKKENLESEEKQIKQGKDNEDESSPLDDELQSVIQEENDLNKQIEEAQKLDEEKPNSQDFDLHFFHSQSEERLGPQINQMTWGDRMDEIEADLRRPGLALQLHEKLSSPSRKRSLTESIRRQEEKQAKAQEQRERLLENKAQKLRDLAKKVEEVRGWKEELLMKKRDMMEKKLQNAEEKRKMQLQKIKKKAHDEEEKVNEIAFINTLEAQNKRHDVMSRIQGHEARMQDLHGERQRRQEEKAAKEAAAEERRRALEADRQARLADMQERRRRKQDKIDKQHQEKEKERQEQAREKARDREERLNALAAAKQAEVEELQKKIQQKQEESARRHDENIEHIRQKALELSILRYSSSNDDAPRLVPYETKKLCTICNELIGAEVYLMIHLRGKKHQQMMKDENSGKEPSKEELEKYNLKYIVNAPAGKTDPHKVEEKERQKMLKKKCKKLRQKLNNRGSEFEENFQPESVDARSKLVKHLKDLLKCVQRNGALPSNTVTSIERTLGEIGRHFEKKGDNEKTVFRNAKGFQVIGQVWESFSRPAPQSPNVKVFLALCYVMHVACENNVNNCTFVLRNNRILNLIDALITRLDILIPDDERGGGGDWTLASDVLAAHLVHLVALVLDGSANGTEKADKESWQTRADDVL